MPTRNVFLTDRQETLIEVMREGLRLVEDREAEEIRKLEALRAAVKLGEQASKRGEYKDFSTPQAMTDHLDDLAARIPRRSAK